MTQRGKKYQGAALAVAVLAGTVAFSSAAGALTTTTTISSEIGSVISLLTSSGTVNVNVTPTASGAQTVASDTVTVSTNNTDGYTLELADSDADNTLVSGSDTIDASAGTLADPVVQAAGTWGYRVDDLGDFAGPTTPQNSTAIGSLTFAKVPVSGTPDTLKATATTASSDTTTVWYGVSADTTQPTGTYTDEVTYTATAN